ncbi:MAG: Zn-ribbon domain-containing OB-fold protein [Haloarculaceae archaeon]
MSDRARDGEYDDLLDAIEADGGYYVECENGHGSLPPRRVCPHCGSRDLSTPPLPDGGEVVTFTEISVPTPRFEEDAPYVTALAAFGPVTLTGLLRGVDASDVEPGMTVGVGVEATETTGERTIVFRPR